MRRYLPLIRERNGLAIGDRVTVTKAYRKIYPKSATDGVITNFCLGTDVWIKFDTWKHETTFDERFLEKRV